MRCLLVKLSGLMARRGAVSNGRNVVALWADPTAFLMAQSVHGPCGGERGCLVGCWGAGDHARKRRGRRAVCGRVSRLAHWRALGSLAERLGMLGQCSPGAGSARGLDRGWRWTVVSAPNMLARLGAAPSFLSTWGWQVRLDMVTIDGYCMLTVVLKLVNLV